MSTRHRHEGTAPAANGFASSPVYTAARGIGGTETTAKASLLLSARCRSLLFFIQALSWRKGGVRKLAADVIAAYPDRLGTPTMHRLGTKPGKLYSEVDARHITAELNRSFQFLHFADPDEDCVPLTLPRENRTAEYFLKLCRSRVSELADLMGGLCFNPYLEFCAPDEPEMADLAREEIRQRNLGDSSTFHEAGLVWFHDVIGALFDFQARYAREAREALADTGVALKVCAAMDRALRHKRMVQIMGESGIGKSASVENWCETHLGDARLVTLSGITEQISFFQRIAESLGVASGNSQSLPKMKARIESMLRGSGLTLVIDEAHFLFPPNERVSSRPRLLDWIDTACCNNGVPVVLSATPQFQARLAQLEKQSIGKRGLWNSAQFHRRCRDRVLLPANVSAKDALAVVLKLWPEASPAMAAQIVVWATGGKVSQQWPLSWIRDLISDAVMFAEDDGRKTLTPRDVSRAFKELREPSDMAHVGMLAAADAADAARHPRRQRRAEAVVPVPGNDDAAPLQTNRLAGSTPAFGARSRTGAPANTEVDAVELTTG